jgi:hypothetical protein
MNYLANKTHRVYSSITGLFRGRKMDGCDAKFEHEYNVWNERFESEYNLFLRIILFLRE